MPEAAPEYTPPTYPEPSHQTPDFDDHVDRIDHEAVQKKYKELKPLEHLIEKGKKQLPTEPYSYEIYQIRDHVLRQAEKILKLKEDIARVSLNELAKKLQTDYGAKKIEDLLYKPPVQPTEFDQSKADCQTLWKELTSKFSEVQAAVREWFENELKIKIFRPKQGERFDPTWEEITQYSIINPQNPINPKSGVYISNTPCLMLGNKVIEKAKVELVESVSTRLEMLELLAENYKLDKNKDEERERIEELISNIKLFLSGKARFDRRTIPILPTTYREICQALGYQEINGHTSIAHHRGAVLNMSFEDGHFVSSEKPGISDSQQSRVPRIILTVEHQG